MRRTTPRLLAAGAASFALLLSACGGDDDDGESTDTGDDTSEEEPAEDEGDEPEASGGGSFSYAITEPSFLAPTADCYESECSAVLRLTSPPPFEVDGDTGELTPMVASDITPNEDSTVFTMTLNEGWTFENGEPVDADAFIRAWNHAAYGPSATRTGGTWWSIVEGFDEMQGEIETDDDGNVNVVEEPETDQLSGVTKVDDYTIEIALKEPFSQFPMTMSYAPAVAPIAEECLEDLEACNEQPISYGPYLFDGPWQHDQEIRLKKNPDYQGPNPGNADEIVYKIYADQSTALRDFQAGNLDIMQPLSEELPTAEDAAGGRIIREPSSSFMYLGLPVYEPGLDDVRVRHALSLAIDRQALVDNIFNGVGFPADDVITPVIPGYQEGACEYCSPDVERAQELWNEADPDIEELTIYFNEGAGHERWTEAVGNMWRDTFGIEFNLEPNAWADHLEKLQIAVNDPEGAADSQNAMHGPYRLGWIMDYPSPYNYLDPLYGPDGSSNYTTWESDAFNEAIGAGNANPDPTDAVSNEYRQAADVVIEEMPILPITFGESIRIYSERVDNLNYDRARTEVRFEEVQVVAE